MQEQWTWAAWLGAVVGSAMALGLVAADATDPIAPVRWLPELLAVGVPLLVTDIFVARNAPRRDPARLAFLSAICGGCLAALAIVVVLVRMASRS